MPGTSTRQKKKLNLKFVTHVELKKNLIQYRIVVKKEIIKEKKKEQNCIIINDEATKRMFVEVRYRFCFLSIFGYFSITFK